MLWRNKDVYKYSIRPSVRLSVCWCIVVTNWTRVVGSGSSLSEAPTIGDLVLVQHTHITSLACDVTGKHDCKHNQTHRAASSL